MGKLIPPGKREKRGRCISQLSPLVCRVIQMASPNEVSLMNTHSHTAAFSGAQRTHFEVTFTFQPKVVASSCLTMDAAKISLSLCPQV